MIQYPFIFFLVVMLSTLITALEKSINKAGDSTKEIPVGFYVPNEYCSDDDVASIDYEIISWQNQLFQKRYLSKGNKHRKNTSGINRFISKKALLHKHNPTYNSTSLIFKIQRNNIPCYLCFRNLRI